MRQQHRCRIVGVLSLLVIVSVSSVSLVQATPEYKDSPKWFYLDYFIIPPGYMYKTSSNLWWWDNQPVDSTVLYYERIERGPNKTFIYRTALEKIDYNGDGIVDGTYLVDATIIWDMKKYDPDNAVFSKAFFDYHSGTGIFEGMKIHEVISEAIWCSSMADVPPEYDPYPLPAGYESYEGPLVIRRHVGQVFNAPEPPMTV